MTADDVLLQKGVIPISSSITWVPVPAQTNGGSEKGDIRIKPTGEAHAVHRSRFLGMNHSEKGGEIHSWSPDLIPMTDPWSWYIC